MRRITGIVIGVVAAGALLCGALPASAQTRALSDPSGDAPAFLDLTSVRVHDQKKDLVVEAIVPGFDPARLNYPERPIEGGDDWGTLFLYVEVHGSVGSAWTPTWQRHVGRFLVEVGPAGATNPVDNILLSRRRGDSYWNIPCTGMDATVAAGIITARVPQSCFRAVAGAGAGAVKVKAIMSGNADSRVVEDRARTTPWVHKAKR